MKKTVIFLLLPLFLFFSGCVYIEVYHKFYPNSTSLVISQIKYDNLVEVLKKTSIKPQNFENWEEFLYYSCKNLGNLTNFSYICNKKENWLIVENKEIATKNYIMNYYNAFPFEIYEIKIFKLPDLPFYVLNSSLNSTHLKILVFNYSFSTENKYLMQLQASGLKYKYTIDVPGQIIEYNHGKLIDNRVVVDPFDVAFSEEKFIYIKSRELNLRQASILIITFLVLFLFFDLVIILALNSFRKRIFRALEEKKILEEKRGKKIFDHESDQNINSNLISFPSSGEKKFKK
ncbi:MAG: hypothetical protein QXG16_00395 [Candidatus Anstonellaceae archaeon]